MALPWRPPLPQALSQIPKALGKFRYRDGALMAAIQDAALAQAAAFDASNVIAMTGALGAMKLT